MRLTPPSTVAPHTVTVSNNTTGTTLAQPPRVAIHLRLHGNVPGFQHYVVGEMASSTAPTQDSNATPCFQPPVDGAPQTMSVDEIPTPNDSNQSILMSKKDTGGKFSVGTYTFNEEIVRKELASMIVLHEYPLSMVEHFGFRRFLSSLQLLFKVVSRNTVKNDIMKIYEFEKTKTMRIIE
ncbi:hypothetical protein ACS0TY_007403 [Phlomoides rotata]